MTAGVRALEPDNLRGTRQRHLKDFAAFAHAMRQSCAAGMAGGARTIEVNDRYIVLSVADGLPPIRLTPALVDGPHGLECFIRCRQMACASAGPSALVAVFRCSTTGVVTRHPESAAGPMGFLTDSVAARVIAVALVREAEGRLRARPVAGQQP